MSGITYLTSLDVFPLAASLHSRLGQLFGSLDDKPLHICQVAYLDEDGKPRTRKAVWEKWQALQNVVNRIRRHDLMKPREVGNIQIERLAPRSGYVTHPPDPEWQRLHLGLVTNNLAIIQAALQVAHVEAGALHWLNTALPHLEANFGEFPRFHLVLSFRERASDDD